MEMTIEKARPQHPEAVFRLPEMAKTHFGCREVGKLKKLHEFGSPDIDHWTTLQVQPGSEQKKAPATAVREYSVTMFSLVSVILACYFTGARPNCQWLFPFLPNHPSHGRLCDHGVHDPAGLDKFGLS